MTPGITGAELRHFREEKNLSLEELGKLIGGKVPTTIMRWEKGSEIPGDTQLLLKLLIHGEMPFTSETVPEQLRESIWQIQMSVGAWEEINRRRIAGGFATVTDWIASLVREKLAEELSKQSVLDTLPKWRTGGEGKLDRGARHVAEESPPYLTDPKAEAAELAADWVAKNSPPGGAVPATPDSGAESQEKAGGAPKL